MANNILISQNFNSSGNYIDSLWDVEAGASENASSKTLFVVVNNDGGSFVNFSAGKMTILKQFETSQIIYSQTILFSAFNSGSGRVLIHDFGVSDEKVKFKILIDENFVANDLSTGGFYYEANAQNQKRIIPSVFIKKDLSGSSSYVNTWNAIPFSIVGISPNLYRNFFSGIGTLTEPIAEQRYLGMNTIRLKNFYCRLQTNNTLSDGVTSKPAIITLRINGANTPFTLTIPADALAGTEFFNLSVSPNIQSSDAYSLYVDTGGATIGSCGLSSLLAFAEPSI